MILVSIGHHQYSKGASFKSFNEFDEAKLWAPLIAENLGSLGIVVPVGNLRKKVKYINQVCDNTPERNIAIEIHFNMAWGDKNHDGNVDDDEYLGRGSESLYYPGSHTGKELAEQIQTALSIPYPPNRGAKEGWYKMNKANGPDFFLKHTHCTSVIVEPEFVHHADKIEEGRDVGCKLIADALFDYHKELNK